MKKTTRINSAGRGAALFIVLLMINTLLISVADAGTISVRLENDSFDGASDADYTQGLQLSYAPDAPPKFLVDWLNNTYSSVTEQRELSTEYFLGQAIYTPFEIFETGLVADDRPYAGWLYMGGALSSSQLVPERNLKIVDRLELSVGIVGPSSLADRTQRWAHELLGTYEVNGWNNQLRDEPAVVAGYTRKWARIRPLQSLAKEWELSGILGGNLGNVSTQLAAGVGVRIGQNLHSSVSAAGQQPMTVAPLMSGPGGQPGWSVFAQWQVYLVGRNIFLDGNTYKDSHSVEKSTAVGEWQLGVAVSSGRYGLAVYHVRRSREFVGQYENSVFSGVSLSVGF